MPQNLRKRIPINKNRWNTALLRVYDSSDTYDSEITDTIKIIELFKWQKCFGAHPTYMGGSEEVYAIAEKIIEVANEGAEGDSVMTLDDLDVERDENCQP